MKENPTLFETLDYKLTRLIVVPDKTLSCQFRTKKGKYIPCYFKEKKTCEDYLPWNCSANYGNDEVECCFIEPSKLSKSELK
jgi:hypothetical protein